VRLAAWFVGDFLLLTCYENYPVTGFYQLWEYSDPDQLPFTVFNVPIPAAHPHFPFGLDVEAD